jgi:membrane protein
MTPPTSGDGWIDKIRYGLWRARTFMAQDLWTVSPAGKLPRFLVHLARMLVLVFEGSVRSDVFLLSAGLTYQVIFSLIPLLAVILSFFKAFGGMSGLGDQVRAFIIKQFSAGDLGDSLKNYIDQFVDQTNEATLGVVGFIVLIVTSFSLLTSMEKSFNKVWAVHTVRPILRRFTIYWAILTVAPIFLALSLTATSFLQSQFLFVWLSEKIPFFNSLVLTLAPFLFTWIVFTILYVMMPNTHVEFGAALIGAVVAGTLWELAKSGYVWYNTQFISAYKIYGSLGAIPVFLLWVYISWVIVLFGAEISYGFQHVKTYRREIESPIVSQSFREKLAVLLVLDTCQAFIAGSQPPTAETLATKLNVPRRIVNDVLYLLVEQKILRELKSPDKDDPGLVPARDPESILVRDVIRSLHNYGSEPCPLPDGQEMNQPEENFKRLSAAKPS